MRVVTQQWTDLGMST